MGTINCIAQADLTGIELSLAVHAIRTYGGGRHPEPTLDNIGNFPAKYAALCLRMASTEVLPPFCIKAAKSAARKLDA